MYFEQLISLNRFSDNILLLNNSQFIDWDCTWNALQWNPTTEKTQTNFTQSSNFTFAAKLQSRSPEIYLPQWDCFLCNNGKES